MTLLEIRGLNVAYNKKNVLSDINLSLNAGEILGIVGQSGCGKSTLLKTILHILPPEAHLTGGDIFYNDANITRLTEKNMQHIRGGEIGMIFQNAQTTLCPVRTIGQQLVESVAAHRQNCTKKEIIGEALNLLAKIRLTDGEKILQNYPFELSGGMNQRISIVLAMLLKPKLLLADEPTSALDVVSQAQVIEEMLNLQRLFHTGIIFVSHNLSLVARIANKTAIMQSGKIVEYGETTQIMRNPRHAYTKELLNSIFHLNLKRS